MRTALLAAILVSAIAGAARAEGEGEPFPFQAPSVTTVTADLAKLPSKGQDPFPFRGRDTIVSLTDPAVLSSISAEAPVQSANSLPPGFSAGTPAFEQRQRVLAYRIHAVSTAAVWIGLQPLVSSRL